MECIWQTLLCIDRSYTTEKQVGQEIWYFVICHAPHMLNQVPGHLGCRLTSPFELVYGYIRDSSTWFELFLMGYFPMTRKSGESVSTTQAYTRDGIAVGRDDKSNTIIFYNPLTHSYYHPPVFKLYPRNICFDGGLICGLLCNSPKPFPLGSRVNIKRDGQIIRGTIQNVPLPFSLLLALATTSSPTDAPAADSSTIATEVKSTYTIHLNDGTTLDTSFADIIKPSTQ